MKSLHQQFKENIINDNPFTDNIYETVKLFDTPQNFIAWLRYKSSELVHNASEEVKDELNRLFRVRELIRDNDLACEVEIFDIRVSICDNITIQSAIENNIIEIYKHLHGEPNTWE